MLFTQHNIKLSLNILHKKQNTDEYDMTHYESMYVRTGGGSVHGVSILQSHSSYHNIR